MAIEEQNQDNMFVDNPTLRSKKNTAAWGPDDFRNKDGSIKSVPN